MNQQKITIELTNDEFQTLQKYVSSLKTSPEHFIKQLLLNEITKEDGSNSEESDILFRSVPSPNFDLLPPE